MTTPTELGPNAEAFDKLSDLIEPWMAEPDEAEAASSQEINHRRARLENAEALRLARSL